MEGRYSALLAMAAGGMLCVVANASALSFVNYNKQMETVLIAARINDRGGSIDIGQDLDCRTAGWYTQLPTAVRDFKAGGLSGAGMGSYADKVCPADVSYFSIHDDKLPGVYGRGDSISGRGFCLDSDDISQVTLEFAKDLDLKNQFFYLMDPSGMGGGATIAASNWALTYHYMLENANLWFVGKPHGEGRELPSLSWSTGESDDDGWGVGYFGKVKSSVPEPAAMVLFGTGLAGFASFRRRK